MDVSMVATRSRSRPATAPSRFREFEVVELSEGDLNARLSVIPFERTRRDLHAISQSTGNSFLRPDDCELMEALMKRTTPSIPERSRKPAETETTEKNEIEDQLYIRNLSRAIDEGVVKRRRPHQRSVGSLKEVAEKVGAPCMSHPDADARVPGKVEAEVSEDDALQMWMREMRQCGCIDNKAQSFITSRSLLNALNKGRFPMDANEPLSKAIRNSEKTQKVVSDEAFLTTIGSTEFSSSCTTSNRPTLMERLKQEPVRSWRVMHNITNAPPPRIAVRDRKGGYTMPEDCMISEKWRHRFDHVNYVDQIKMDESLAMRDLCRNMVVRQECESSGQPPFVALADMFNKRNTPLVKGISRGPPARGTDAVTSSVWLHRANEISLGRERIRLIDVIKNFELRVVASLLSKEVVERMRDDLVKLLQQWPCNYKKRHIFTKANFVEWVRARYKLSPTVGNPNDPDSPSLLESMASAAEASFVEFVLKVLPM